MVIIGVAFVFWTTVMEKEEQAYPRPCPVCGVAMVGEKDDPERGERRFDRHVCLSCGSVIDNPKLAPAPEPSD